MTKRISSLFIFLFLFGLKSLIAQVTIAPTMLFLNEQNRFGTVVVMNGSDEVQEISIEFPFGYPVTNDEGKLQMVYNDSSDIAQKRGLHNAIKGFPKNFSLQPGQRQVVRLTVRPQNFTDGMYWSRIRTTSVPQTAAVGEAEEGEITTEITYKFEQVTTLFYKHGNLNTGIDIKEVHANNHEENIDVVANVSRTGNAPFLGSIYLTVSDQEGNTVVEKKISTSIYFDYKQVFTVSKEELKPGNYEAQVRFVSRRNDVSPEDIVAMDKPVNQSINFSVE